MARSDRLEAAPVAEEALVPGTVKAPPRTPGDAPRRTPEEDREKSPEKRPEKTSEKVPEESPGTPRGEDPAQDVSGRVSRDLSARPLENRNADGTPSRSASGHVTPAVENGHPDGTPEPVMGRASGPVTDETSEPTANRASRPLTGEASEAATRASRPLTGEAATRASGPVTGEAATRASGPVTGEAPEPAVRPRCAPAELALTRPRGLAGLLWQDLGQAGFGVRRFRLGQARPRLEAAGQACLAGYNAVVAGEAERIDDLEEELRGFAYEGAGMACATLDVLTVTGGRRLRSLLSGQGMRHPHMIHLGVGWAYARLRMRPMWGIRSVHPLLRWLAFDGFGFHQGFFASDRTVGRQRTAGLLDRTRRAIFDQGVGRMLWFHECAGVDDVILRVAEFPPGRRADLWSGVGLAAGYAGGADAHELERLSVAAAEDGFRAHLVQGTAFACAARLISGSVPEHTAVAASALCEVDVEEAGHWTDTALIALGHNAHSGDHYQAWRAGVRKAWARRNRDS
ncbi:hypothetical protein GCM10017600_64540 [Streptosporangium carneum]|uniref:DUF1702 family protein n=1 Tax=Streptosporangium carneum TaxID=47481 RepID=A0A9W6I8B1_9ACTN|nr:hypothetical protein GCM10017600_64540 [Streptosporangium carneum]